MVMSMSEQQLPVQHEPEAKASKGTGSETKVTEKSEVSEEAPRPSPMSNLLDHLKLVKLKFKIFPEPGPEASEGEAEGTEVGNDTDKAPKSNLLDHLNVETVQEPEPEAEGSEAEVEVTGVTDDTDETLKSNLLDQLEIKVKTVYEKAKGGRKNINSCVEWLISEHSKVLGSEALASKTAYDNSVQKVLRNVHKVQKNRKREELRRKEGKGPLGKTLVEYLNEEFVCPVKNLNLTGKRKSQFGTRESVAVYRREIEALQSTACSLAKELNEQKVECSKTMKEREKSEEVIRKMKEELKVKRKEITSKDREIKKLESLKPELKEVVGQLNYKLAEVGSKTEELKAHRADRKRRRQREDYWREKTQKLEEKEVTKIEEWEEKYSQLEKNLKEKDNIIKELRQTISYLEVVRDEEVEQALEQATSDEELCYSEERKKQNVEKVQQTLNCVQGEAIPAARHVDATSSLLIGKRVSHRFMKDGEEQWYQGQVLSEVVGARQWFNITYDGDASVYAYQLLRDMEDGHLEILL